LVLFPRELAIVLINLRSCASKFIDGYALLKYGGVQQIVG